MLSLPLTLRLEESLDGLLLATAHMNGKPEAVEY